MGTRTTKGIWFAMIQKIAKGITKQNKKRIQYGNFAISSRRCCKCVRNSDAQAFRAEHVKPSAHPDSATVPAKMSERASECNFLIDT